MFPVAHRNDRLHAKTVVFGVTLQGKAVALTESFMKAHPEARIDLTGRQIRLQRGTDGQVIARDQDGKVLLVQRLFWFAWATH
jgi:hypothetical protein